MKHASSNWLNPMRVQIVQGHGALLSWLPGLNWCAGTSSTSPTFAKNTASKAAELYQGALYSPTMLLCQVHVRWDECGRCSLIQDLPEEERRRSVREWKGVRLTQWLRMIAKLNGTHHLCDYSVEKAHTLSEHKDHCPIWSTGAAWIAILTSGLFSHRPATLQK